ncbi:MAG: PQQ-dependent sugar dehydrogenase [Deltaproteobacteria bacterium]|nr:PQQ-dependent sugar dehydrogenase [Deltaproteobacteria bacterium]
MRRLAALAVLALLAGFPVAGRAEPEQARAPGAAAQAAPPAAPAPARLEPPAIAPSAEQPPLLSVAPEVAGALTITELHGGLELPTALEFLPDGSLLIAEKGGRLILRRPGGEVVVAGKLDVDQETEKGLLNVLAHPDFARNRQLIVYYSAKDAPVFDKHRIVTLRLGEDGLLDLASEQVLVRGLLGPDDHEQGGGLAIDSTGHLLVGVGDTGCRAHKLPDPPYTPTNYFATCLSHGNGKILRVALDGSVPADNPLLRVNRATVCGQTCGDDPFELAPGHPRRDIWAWGLRNPWRIWVDSKTGAAWVGDVGDLGYEEIDVIPREGGRHYGWPFREGPAGHPVDTCRKTLPDRGDCAEPAYACRHDDVPGELDAGCKSINGGLIVDHCTWPDDLRGRYYFADNANGRIWSVQPTPDRLGVVPGSRQDIGALDGFVVDLEVGGDGALYAALMRIPPADGKVVRIAPRTPRACAPSERSRSPRATAAVETSAATAPKLVPAVLRRPVVAVVLVLALVVAAVAAWWSGRR